MEIRSVSSQRMVTFADTFAPGIANQVDKRKVLIKT